jgi:hypothetical protein
MEGDSMSSTWGEPDYSNTDAMQGPTQMTAIADYAALVSVRGFATQAALLSATGMAAGYLAKVTAIPGVLFVYNGTTWVMFGTPSFADAGTRDAAITTPANGMEAYLEDVDIWTRRIGGAWVNWRSEQKTATGLAVTGMPAPTSSTCTYWYDNGAIEVEGEIVLSGPHTGAITVASPVAFATPSANESHVLGTCKFIDVGTTSVPGLVDATVANVVRLLLQVASGTNLVVGNLAAGNPFTSVSGDRFKYRYRNPLV